MKLVIRLAIVTMLLFQLAGVYGTTTEQVIWIVNTDNQDTDLNLAIDTFKNEIIENHVEFNEISLSKMENIHSEVDMLVVVGHGQKKGLEFSGDIIPWPDLYNKFEQLNPKTTVVLACNSPSYPEKGIYGFRGQIDAEAGAIYASRLIGDALDINFDNSFLLNRITGSQTAMLHPLESVLYFVHGYHGYTGQWDNMEDYLDDEDIIAIYDNVKRFNYADYWMNENPEWDIDDVHTYCTISDLAMGFVFEIMDSNYAPGTQIDIVSHSMGGLITRELLRVYRSDLQYYHDVDFGRVITLGTPHEGTNLAEGFIPSVLLLILMSLWGPNWDSLLLNTMAPDSSFLTTLNANPSDYSNDIMWTTIAGFDLVGDILTNFHGGPNDKIVAYWSAHLSFADPHFIQYIDHEGLLIDTSNRQPGGSFDIVAEALGPEIDSDNDGLSDIEEKFVYNTYPNNPNSDGDVIWDENEVDWGYDPLDSNDPIPASSLVSSVSYTSSTRSVRVYVNHFTNMDYVKFYVKYYKSGSWTGYYYMGTDTTPYTGGDYYDSWTHPTGYTKMTIYVKAYDSSGHYLGCDYYTRDIDSGGGGVPRPPIE